MPEEYAQQQPPFPLPDAADITTAGEAAASLTATARGVNDRENTDRFAIRGSNRIFRMNPEAGISRQQFPQLHTLHLPAERPEKMKHDQVDPLPELLQIKT